MSSRNSLDFVRDENDVGKDLSCRASYSADGGYSKEEAINSHAHGGFDVPRPPQDSQQNYRKFYDYEPNENSTNTRISEDHGNDHPSTSKTTTFVNLVKASVGTGVLAMPGAVKNAGLLVGTVGILLIGLLTTYCCHLVLQVYTKLGDGKSMSYDEVIYEVSTKSRISWIRKLAGFSKTVIKTVLIVTQVGTCCVYILFISRIIKAAVEDAYPDFDLSLQIYEVMVVALLIPYCFVRTLKVLSYFSFAANVVSAVGLAIALQAIEDVDLVAESPATFPLFFGTAMFAFECIVVILPMENKMEDRESFHRWNGLLTLSLTVVIALYTAVGFFGYLAFGDEASVILSNLPSGNWLYLSVNLMYAAAIFVSYNLQLYVPVDICFPLIRHWLKKRWFDRFGEYILRIVFVLITLALSAAVPCLELMISFFGAVGSGSLAIIFPPLIEIIACTHEDKKWPWYHGIKGFILLIVGFFGCVIGAVVAVQQIVAEMSSPEGCSS